MAPKRSRHDEGADLELRRQLAEMKRVPLEQVGRIRMTPDKLPSLVDVGVILTGKAARHVADDLSAVMHKHSEVSEKVGHFHFGGQGQRATPVPKDLTALIEIIFLLPGRAAAQVRRAAAQIFVRYLGGDLTLIQEVEHLRHVQNFLRETAPEHPMRAFGEAVENSESPELKRKREEAELKEVEMRLKKAAMENKCLELQQQEAEARVAIALEDQKCAAARTGVALEEQQRATEARRIANLREWIELSGANGAVEMAPADRVAANDMMRTIALGGTGAMAGLGVAICLESFLREKGVPQAVRLRADFGKAVLKVWKERYPDQEPPKKQVFVNGQELLVNSYWEKHRGIVEEAFTRWRAPASEVPREDIRRHLRRSG